MKRWVVSMLVAASMVAFVPGTASADKATPVGRCTDGYGDPVTIKQAVKLTGASTADVHAQDKNGDGFVCVKELPTPPPNHNVIDNNASL